MEIVGAIAGNDAVASALRFVDSDPTIIVDAHKHAGIKRYVVVGGAGSLEAAPGKQLVAEPNFPVEYRAESLKARDHRLLVDYEALGADAVLSVPAPDHYLPSLYVVEGVDGGSISMLSVELRSRL